MIAFAFKSVGWIERYGSGITRILRICKEYGVIAPTVKEEKDGFVVTIYNEKLGKTSNVTDDVTDRNALIAIEMKQNKSITTTELAEKLKVSKRTILRDI